MTERTNEVATLFADLPDKGVDVWRAMADSARNRPMKARGAHPRRQFTHAPNIARCDRANR